MDEHINAYFHTGSADAPGGRFRAVLKLHEDRPASWEDLHELVPSLPRGWYELATLSAKDRVEFTRDFWSMKLPFHSKFPAFISEFFGSLRDVGVYVTQQRYDDPYEAHLVYGLKDDCGFFRGSPPALEDSLTNLKGEFAEVVLPADFLAFLEIHDGFYKYTDTGITSSKRLLQKYQEFQAHLEKMDPLLNAEGSEVNPKHLIPFYESFGFPCYQCFWADWYPDQEMGNIYYSGLTHTISMYRDDNVGPENMSFPTFLDWLMFYLETIKV